MMWFLRFSLFLTVYFLASSGVQAQVVGEKDSTHLLWEFAPIYGSMMYWTPMFLSKDKNFILTTCWYDGVLYDKKNHLQKIDLLTGEVVQEVEVSNKQKFYNFVVAGNSDLMAYNKGGSDKVFFYSQSSFDSLFTIGIEQYMIHKLYKEVNYPPMYAYGIDEFTISNNGKYLIYNIGMGDGMGNEFQSCAYIYNIENKQLIDSLVQSNIVIREMEYSPNDELLAILAEYKNSGDDLLIFIDTKTNTSIKTINPGNLFQNYSWENHMYFTEDNRYLILENQHKKDANFYRIDLLNFETTKVLFKNYASYSVEPIENFTKSFVFTSGMYLYDHIEEKSYELPEEYKEGVILCNEELKIILIYTVSRISCYKYNLDEITSVTEKNIQDNLIFPNPADDYIEITVDGDHLEGGLHLNIAIYDVLGECVWKSNSVASKTLHRSVSTTERIDISHLPRGVYFLRIGNRLEKFLKK